MMLNLTQHRSGPNIWERKDTRTLVNRDAERWVLATLAGAFLLAGFRRRTWSGLAFVVGGSGLAWWAAAEAGDRRMARARLKTLWPSRPVQDLVESASEGSFPASDAPPFFAGVARMRA